MQDRSSHDLDRGRRFAAQLSLGVGTLVFLLKVVAWQLTDSTAVYSDALESIVNVIAASLLVMSLRIAIRPADDDHPYGHGKAEFLSAGVEGSMIFLAAVLIAIEAGNDLVVGSTVRRPDTGAWMILAVSGINLGLGLYLLRTGRRIGSLALEADGRHVLTDVWTSVGVVAGLLGVWLTGWTVLDPITALLVAANILREGYSLVRQALAGLMDEASPEIIEQVTSSLDASRRDEWIDVHGLREWRSGDVSHVDLHVVVPRYLDVDAVHGVHEEIQQALRAELGPTTECVIHFDPCRPPHCAGCAMQDCPVRSGELQELTAFTPERAVSPLDPLDPDNPD